MKDLVDDIIAEEFGSPDLELHWLDEDDGDPETVLVDRVKLGAITLNEMRAHLGLDPYANAAADRPMALTATGYVPIEANAGGSGPGAVIDRVGPPGTLSSSEYGTKIHTEFAAAVRAEGLAGVEVEQTFGLDPDDTYGAAGSIRTDVVLHGEAGNISAI